MITIIVSLIVSAATTMGLYYILHRANPTATQTALDSVVTKAETDVKAVASDAEAAVVTEVKKV